MSRLWTLALLVALSACAEAPELAARGSNPRTPHEERLEDLREALAHRDPGIALDLVARAERLVQGGPEERACALDVLSCLVEATDKSARPLAVRLADSECPLLRSRPALEVLAKHQDPTVRDLARAGLRK